MAPRMMTTLKKEQDQESLGRGKSKGLEQFLLQILQVLAAMLVVVDIKILFNNQIQHLH